MKKMSKKVKGISVLLALGLFLLIATGIWLAQGPQSLVGKTNETKVEKKKVKSESHVSATQDDLPIRFFAEPVWEKKSAFPFDVFKNEDGEEYEPEEVVPGYVTEKQAEEGWVRSNDTVELSYLIKIEQTGMNMKNAVVEFSGGVLEDAEYSYLSDDVKIRNVTTKFKEKRVEFPLDYGNEGRQISISLEISSAFFETELPFAFKAKIVQFKTADDKEINVDEGYEYDLTVPFPNKTLKVSSVESVRPVLTDRTYNSMNYKDTLNDTTFDELVNNINPPREEDRVHSIGYAWIPQPLTRNFVVPVKQQSLGLSVFKLSSHFNLEIKQSISAKSKGLSYYDELKLGEDAQFPPMTIFSSGKANTPFGDPVGAYKDYVGYNRGLLGNNYYPEDKLSGYFSFSTVKNFNYLFSDESKNGIFKLDVSQLGEFVINMLDNGVGWQPNFGVGSYIVYQDKPFNDVIEKQKYKAEISKATYQDNQGKWKEVDLNSLKTNKAAEWEKEYEVTIPPGEGVDFTLYKRDSQDNKKYLSDAEFILEYYDKDDKDNPWKPVEGERQNWVTPSKGYFKLSREDALWLDSKYPSEKYRFREVVFPSGYREPEEPVTAEFTLTENQLFSPDKAYVDNDPFDSTIVLEKVDRSNQHGIPNTTFVLQKKDEKTGEYKDTKYEFTTDSSGQLRIGKATSPAKWKEIIDDVGLGTFRFKETIPNQDYEMPQGEDQFSAPFTVVENETVGYDVQPNKLKMENDKKKDLSVEMTKTDKDTGDPIGNTTFVLQKKDEETGEYKDIEIVITTGNDGKFTIDEKLWKEILAKYGIGTYRFKEEKSNPAYQEPQENDRYSKEFVVTEDDVNPNRVEMTNQKKIYTITLKKIDEDTKKGIGDVRLVLQYYNQEKKDYEDVSIDLGSGKLTEVGVSTGSKGEGRLPNGWWDKVVEQYGTGTYRFKETNPNENYEMPQGNDQYSDSFEVNEYEIVPSEITMTNKRINKVIHKESASAYSQYGYDYGYNANGEKEIFGVLPSAYYLMREQKEGNNFGTLENDDKYKTSFKSGNSMRGQEIYVQSYAKSYYYDYMEETPEVKDNWRVSSMTLLQVWNPAEGEVLEAMYGTDTEFSPPEEAGELQTIRYGIKADDDYSITALNKVTIEAETDGTYEWYEDLAEAQAVAKERGKKVSAVLGGTKNMAYDYENTIDKTVYSELYLYTRRVVTGTPGGYGIDNEEFKEEFKDHAYMTISRMSVTYESLDKEKKSATIYSKQGNYEPVKFSDGGTGKVLGVGLKTFGSSMFIRNFYDPYEIKKSSDQKGSGYQLTDIMDFEIKVSFPKVNLLDVYPFTLDFIDDASMDKNSTNDPTDVNFTYMPGSSLFNGEKISDPSKIVSDSKGTSYQWSGLEVNMMENLVYNLKFSAYPKKVIEFYNMARIEYTSALEEEEKSHKLYVRVLNEKPHVGISKVTTTPVLEPSGSNSKNKINYQLLVYNYLQSGLVTDVSALDILPFSGADFGKDKEGNPLVSDFKGEYRLENVEVIDIKDGLPLKEAEVYYTVEESIRDNKYPMDSINFEESDFGEGSFWRPYSENLNDDIVKEIKAVYVKLPDMLAGDQYLVNINLIPQNNEQGNVYHNAAQMQFKTSGGEPFLLNSPVATTVVVDREIEGFVWTDADYDGLFSDSEEVVNDIPVALFKYNKDGKLEKLEENNLGENLEGIVTKEGKYTINGLSSGGYYVGFELVDKYKDWLITRTNIPIPPDRPDILGNNKVSQTDVIEVDGKTYHLTENAVEVPYTVTNSETGLLEPNIVVNGINMGILAKPELKVKKAVYNKDNVKINGDKVKVGDQIRYEITVENPQENSYVGDVSIYDKLPRGLQYVKGTLKQHLTGGTTKDLDDSNFNEEGTILSTEPLGSIRGATATTGESIKISFEVLVTSGANGDLVNQASATGELHPDGSESNDVKNDLSPDLTIKKTSNWDKDEENPEGIGIPKVGDIIEYTLTVENAAGASTAKNVIVTDTLPDYLEYVEDSTSLQDPSGPAPSVTPGESVQQDDKEIWNLERPQSLSIDIGDFEGSATGLTKTITFNVKLKDLPEEEENGSRTIINKAVVNGEDLDEKPLKKKEAENKIPLTDITNKAKLHVRQVVVNREESLVVPTVGYLRLTQLDGDKKVIPKASSAINIVSTLKPAEETFTIFELALDTDEKAVRFDLNVPQYYEYIGEVHTKTFDEPDKEKHKTDMPEETNVLTLTDVKDSDEYWVSLYLKPKFGKDEEHPRPYSWDYKTNDFGNWKSNLSNK